MQYCINALLKNDNEIMQYCIINNDIALIMHYRALLQMPDIIIQVHLNYSEKYFLKIYSKLWPILLKFLIKLHKKWIFL